MQRFSLWTRRFLAILAVMDLLLGTAWTALTADGNAEGAQSRADSDIVLLAKRRKTTPTPKPRTPKPASMATPVPASDEDPEEAAVAITPSPVPSGPIIDPQSITDWLFAHDFTLPDNFITKQEAQALGWNSRYNKLSDVAPGKSIGGDRVGNYDGKLPTARGRRYYECDCWYIRGSRNACRLVYSNDGLVFYTEDHYNTFTRMYPSVPQTEAAP